MSFITDLFSGGAGTVIKSVGDVIDQCTTTKEEKMQLELEMKKAEMQFQVDMQKISLEEKKAFYGEMDSARQHDSAIQTSPNATKLSKNTAPFLALGTTLLTFGLFLTVIFYDGLEGTKKDVVIYILGVLSAVMTQVFSFYFGSSQGSSDKNEMLKKIYK